MFWGLIMEPKRRYFQEVTRPFHISMASLDLGASTKEPVQLMAQFQNRNYLLCTLQKGSQLQVPLDLNFEVGDEVAFTINGQSHVHLSGYHLEDEFDDDDDADEDDSDVEDEEVEKKQVKGEENVEEPDLSLSNIVYGKRKQPKTAATSLTPAAKRSKTLELLNEAGSDDDDDEDEDVTFSDLDDDGSDDTEGQLTLDNIDDDSNDDDSDLEPEEEEDDDEEGDVVEDDDVEEAEDEEQEDEEEDSEEEIEKQIVEKKLSKKEKQQLKQAANKQQQQQQQVKSPEKQQKKKQKEQQQPQQQQQQPQVNGTPASEKKKKKKNKKKQEQNESVSSDLNVTAKESNKLEHAKTPKSEKKQQNQNSSPQKTFVDRGVTIEELSVGSGNPAKNGKLVHVYYEGRLKNNKKMFDSCLKGPPFKFRLGSAEVIKGWDVGLSGMKVGGKRRITVPAQLGYGVKGNKPAIPPNATLVFDIELKNVS